VLPKVPAVHTRAKGTGSRIARNFLVQVVTTTEEIRKEGTQNWRAALWSAAMSGKEETFELHFEDGSVRELPLEWAEAWEQVFALLRAADEQRTRNPEQAVEEASELAAAIAKVVLEHSRKLAAKRSSEQA
jgi:hypothetical protein